MLKLKQYLKPYIALLLGAVILLFGQAMLEPVSYTHLEEVSQPVQSQPSGQAPTIEFRDVTFTYPESDRPTSATFSPAWMVRSRCSMVGRSLSG